MNSSDEIYAGKCILVVHEDKSFLDLIQKIARELSLRLTVTPALDPRTALEKYRLKGFFDLVILKEDLSKLQGSFLIRKIIELKSQTAPLGFYLMTNSTEKLDLPPLDSIHIQNGEYKEEHIKAWITENLSKNKTPDRSVIQKSFRIDVNFMNPFIEGTVKVLEITCNTKAKKDKVFLRQNEPSQGDISAMIGMVSPLFRGSFGISFSQSCFLSLVNQMLGSEEKKITKENQDAAGEICNQVFGWAKKTLNDTQGLQIQPAIPSVIVGAGHQIKHCVSGPVIAVKFDTDAGPFIVEAALAG